MRRGSGKGERGQSLVEFAVFLPVLLLIFLIALDFGRVYMGWVNLQQMARIAANYAADHASAFYGNPSEPHVVRYRQLVLNEAAGSNCELQGGTVPDPVFEYPLSPRPTGSDVRVTLNCEFTLITPLIGQLVGPSPLTASATSIFPIKEGIVVTNNPVGGGTNPAQPPVADFIGSPRSGWGPLDVTYTDLSTNVPGVWNWSFNVGGSGNGSVTPSAASEQGPITVTYECAGDPGDACTFGTSLQVINSAGNDTESRTDYVTVWVPPDTGPIFDFIANPPSGEEPLQVSFQYQHLSGPPAVTWSWNFGDGSSPSSVQNPAHTYTNEGAYTVTLTAGDGIDEPNVLVKMDYIVVDRKVCTVPVLVNRTVSQARALWEVDFTGSFTAITPPNNDYTIQWQSLPGGTIDPQPHGCDSSITVRRQP